MSATVKSSAPNQKSRRVINPEILPAAGGSFAIAESKSNGQPAASIGRPPKPKLTFIGYRSFLRGKRIARTASQFFLAGHRGKKIMDPFIEDIYRQMEERLIAMLRQKLAPHLQLPDLKDS
jgi:hypothetical protein